MAVFDSRAALVKLMRAQITGSDAQAIRALMRIHQHQTPSEQASHSTHVYNAEGFTAGDAKILSSFADFYKRKNYLSPKQMQILRKRIGKYAGQLVHLSVCSGMIVKIGKRYATCQEDVERLTKEDAVAAKKRAIMEEAMGGF